MPTKPRLYCNSGPNDRQAIELLSKSGIPHVHLGPILEEHTPFLEYGHWRFSGLDGIQEFIERWESKELPPLDIFK